jgi:hypothetical protein
MPTILRGTKAPLQQWFESNFDPTTGYTYRAEFVGTDYDQMAALMNSFTSAGVSAVIRNQFGISTLTLTDATGTVVVDKWELGVDEERPSIFENPLFLSYVNAAANPSRVVTMMRNALQNGDPLNSAWDTLATDSNFTTAANGANLTKLKQYFDDYNLGVTNFVRGKYRLRHTTNAPNRWQVNIADFNVERAYTIAQLLNETQNTSLWVLPLPGYLAYKISNYYVTSLGSPTRANYAFGAFKMRSNACTAAYNRVEIVTEYVIDMINTNLYSFI